MKYTNNSKFLEHERAVVQICRGEKCKVEGVEADWALQAANLQQMLSLNKSATSH